MLKYWSSVLISRDLFNVTLLSFSALSKPLRLCFRARECGYEARLRAKVANTVHSATGLRLSTRTVPLPEMPSST